jgi:predicted ATP-grasp superfamily ATP-dependent carboligase
MDVLEYHSRPPLRNPLLVASFRGSWLDQGEVGATTAAFLRKAWNMQPLASIDPEEFFDFQVVRPQVMLVDGGRRIIWPVSEFICGSIPGAGRDAVVLTSIEPSMRWRTFCDNVMTVVRDSGVEMVITIGGIGSNVPHSRPIRVMGTAADPDIVERYGLSSSRYQGPAGIAHVLHDYCRQAGLPSFGLWAFMPHYVPAGPSPNGALALVRAMGDLLGFNTDTSELETDVGGYQERVQKAVEADPEVANYVRMLERQTDQDTEVVENIPSGDELAAEFEKYLRRQREED